MKNQERKPLVSVTAQDCEWQFFRAGGNGGQNQNKVNSGARCIHHPSGARGEARDSRDQRQNRVSAFERMASTSEFQTWLRLESARVLAGEQTIEAMIEKEVERQMHPKNLRFEYRSRVSNPDVWVEIESHSSPEEGGLE